MSEHVEPNLEDNPWWNKVDLDRAEDRKRTEEIKEKLKEYEDRQKKRRLQRDEEPAVAP